MAIKTPAEQLEEVQTAISRLLSDGQAWQQGTRSQTEAQLEQLEKREQRLQAQVARETNGGIIARRAVAID